MIPLEKLAALGHDRANRILATEVMGWKPNYPEKLSHPEENKYKILIWDTMDGGGILGDDWLPCTDLNHAKMVVDKLSFTDSWEWARALDAIAAMSDWTPSVAAFNAPADARMAAVFEALDLWPEEKGKLNEVQL